MNVDNGTNLGEVTVTQTIATTNQINVGGMGAANAVPSRIFALLFYQTELDAAAQKRVRKYLSALYDTAFTDV